MAEAAMTVFPTSLAQTIRETCRGEMRPVPDRADLKARLRYPLECSPQPPQAARLTDADYMSIAGQLARIEFLLDQEDDP